MECIIVKNGVTRIVIHPKDETEKLLLQDLAKNPVEITVLDRVEILGSNYTDAIILSNTKVQETK